MSFEGRRELKEKEKNKLKTKGKGMEMEVEETRRVVRSFEVLLQSQMDDLPRQYPRSLFHSRTVTA